MHLNDMTDEQFIHEAISHHMVMQGYESGDAPLNLNPMAALADLAYCLEASQDCFTVTDAKFVEAEIALARIYRLQRWWKSLNKM